MPREMPRTSTQRRARGARGFVSPFARWLEPPQCGGSRSTCRRRVAARRGVSRRVAACRGRVAACRGSAGCRLSPTCRRMSRERVTGCHSVYLMSPAVAYVTTCHHVSPTCRRMCRQMSPMCHVYVAACHACVTACHRVSNVSQHVDNVDLDPPVWGSLCVMSYDVRAATTTATLLFRAAILSMDAGVHTSAHALPRRRVPAGLALPRSPLLSHP